jgi:hypothetical protein
LYDAWFRLSEARVVPTENHNDFPTGEHFLRTKVLNEYANRRIMV